LREEGASEEDLAALAQNSKGAQLDPDGDGNATLNITPNPAPNPGPTTGNWIDVADTSWYDKNPNAAEFTISTAEQLAGVAKIVNGVGTLDDNFQGKIIHLVSDIDLAGREWTPISYYSFFYFSGTFDGGENTIANMTINGTDESDYEYYASLFGYSGGGGMLRGIHLTNVSVSSSSSSSSSYAGGLVGYNNGAIENCTASGNVSSSSYYSSYAGGLVGFNAGTIENCTASGNVSSSSSSSSSSGAGGLVGYNNGTIENCTASGRDISAMGENGKAYRGGFIGHNDSDASLTNNHNSTGVSPAIGRDNRKSPAGPSNDI
jgi:hypothetical protein